MGKTNLIQTDFLAGEISPRVEMQNNIEGRKHGVELMENFFTHLQGSAETSRGTEFVDTVEGTTGILFGFPVGLMTGFMVVIAGGQLMVFDSGGVIKTGNVLLNEYFSEREQNWTHLLADPSGSRVFYPGGVLLRGGLNPELPSYIAQTVTIVTGTSYALTIDVEEGDGPLTVQIGSLSGTSDVLDTVIQGTGRKTFTGLVSSTSDMWLRIILELGDPDKLLSGVHLYDPTVGGVSFACPWDDDTEIATLQAHMIPEKTAMLFTSVNAPPYKLELLAGVWSFAALALTSPPATWVGGNYPPAAGFHGGRLWVGGSPSDPSLIWGSKTGDYGNFTLGTLDEDALEFRLGRSGAVNWIAGGPGLLVGTSNAEHVISSEGGVITPSDAHSQVQSTNGSFPTQALEIGNEVVYVSPDGRKIRSIGFEWLKDAWRSRDLTYASEHITEGGRTLTRLCYAANPDSLIVGLTKSGKLTLATYEPYTQTAGFSRRSTQGTIVSVAAVPFNGSDELWMLVHRGGGVLHVERERHSTNIKLDSYTRLYTGSPLSGGTVPHLAEKECQVLVDGAVHPNVTPDEFGVFATEYAGNEILIGLAIDSVIRTLPVADDVRYIGTTRTMKKRFTNVWVRIINSWRPKINGRRPPNRHALTPMGVVEPAQTESVVVTNEGWDMDAQITIEQDLPLRTEVAGWFGRILQEEV